MLCAFFPRRVAAFRFMVRPAAITDRALRHAGVARFYREAGLLK